MPICKACGAEIAEDKHFCSACGASLAAAETPASSPAAVEAAEDPATLTKAPTQPAAPSAPAAPEAAPAAEPPHAAPAAVAPASAGVAPAAQPAASFFRDPRPAKGSRWAPVTLGGWIGVLLLLSIPLVNLILVIVWSCGGCKKRVKADFARAVLILWLISAILTVVGMIVFAQYGTSLVDLAGRFLMMLD